MALADEDRLGTDAVLKREVRRMLADDRIEAFVEAFLDNWLGLRDIGSARHLVRRTRTTTAAISPMP